MVTPMPSCLYKKQANLVELLDNLFNLKISSNKTEMAFSKLLSPAKYILLDNNKLHSVAMVTNEMVLDVHSMMSLIQIIHTAL